LREKLGSWEADVVEKLFDLTVVCGNRFAQLTRDWHAVRSPNFEIVSRYETARIKPLVETLEWARAVMELNFGWKSSIPRPALVLLPDAPYDFERMVISKHTGGFYLNAPWRDIIVLRELTGARHALLHEYTHMVTRHQGARYPAWFHEGLAEFFGSLRENGGVETRLRQVGRAV
jgi:hypothetical protein